MIGLPGDEIQIVDEELFVNKKKILKKEINTFEKARCAGEDIDVISYEEELPNMKIHQTVYRKNGTMIKSDKYVVPENHYFFLGDNRDCSSDSRYLSNVGYVHENNLVGKARIIFFSNDTKIGSVFKFWNWKKSIRIGRFFKTLK